MIGPVMIGPSSSHMAGVVRIGQVAHRLMGGVPEEALITFYNSLGHTYQGHGSAQGVVAGLLNFPIDDKRILRAHEHAKQVGLSFTFRSATRDNTHPNTLQITMVRKSKKRSLLGESVGGGMIQIIAMDDYRCFFTGKEHTLVIYAMDTAGNVAKLAALLFQQQGNIANMTVNRRARKDGTLYVIELDEPVASSVIKDMKAIPFVADVVYIPPIC